MTCDRSRSCWGRGGAREPASTPRSSRSPTKRRCGSNTWATRSCVYQQASWSPDDGGPIHFERGFLRPGEPGRIEFTLAHPIGLTEIAEGTLDGTAFELTSTSVGRTTTGLTTTAVIRSFRVDGDSLRYRTDMATDETPMALHLEAELHRVEP